MLSLTKLHCVEKKDGSFLAKLSNPAVPVEVLQEIAIWKAEGASDSDVVTRLRLKTVPEGYEYHPWKKGYIIII